MPKPLKFSYQKKAPFRDAFFFIIVCEGLNREPTYFRFFDGLSSRVKIVAVEPEQGSAPNRLVEQAVIVEEKLDARADRDRVWFVVDTDRWREHLHWIRQECEQHPHWRVAQSNPCFEVWLYFHAKATVPETQKMLPCNQWKPFLPRVIQGGFNTDIHPIAIERAIANAKAAYSATGHFPNPGSTELWKLAEELLALIQKDLQKLKPRFPEPIASP